MASTDIYASIITIGDELLIGQTIDTNSAFIAKALNNIGIWVKRRVAIGDVKAEILATCAEEGSKSNVVLITGGLGPTGDDITKPALCQYFGSTLVRNDAVLQQVTAIFARVNRPMLASNIKQADVPDNCTVLQNTRGTAPGMWFEKDGVVYVSLPGVPHEMEGLVENEVLPRLQQRFTMPTILHKTLVTFGKGESELAHHIAEFEKRLPSHIKLAYLPAYGMVKLRLTAKGAERSALEADLAAQIHTLKEQVAEWLVAEEDKAMPQIVSELLFRVHKTVATAESCTGGYIAQLLTARAGSSAIYKGGIVSYANDAKEQELGVQHNTLATHGAVSEQTVIEMAKGALEKMTSDYAVATSGIMGPDGGVPDKPVGTVWIAVANRQNVKTVKHFVRFNRQKNIDVTAHFALNVLRQFIGEHEK